MEYWLTRVSWKLLLKVEPHLSLPEKPTYKWKEQSVLLALQTADSTASTAMPTGDALRMSQVAWQGTEQGSKLDACGSP